MRSTRGLLWISTNAGPELDTLSARPLNRIALCVVLSYRDVVWGGGGGHLDCGVLTTSEKPVIYNGKREDPSNKARNLHLAFHCCCVPYLRKKRGGCESAIKVNCWCIWFSITLPELNYRSRMKTTRTPWQSWLVYIYCALRALSHTDRRTCPTPDGVII